MVSAGIDDDLEIGFSRDRLTFRGWCPVVFLANQDENGNGWVNAVVTERIMAMTPATAWSWLVGFFESVASSDEVPPSEKPMRKTCFVSISGIALSTATAARASLL